MTRSLLSPRRAAALAVALLGLLGLLVPPAAWASAGASGTAAQPVTDATFAVVPTMSPMTPGPGALPLAFAPGLLPAAQYFDAVNTGSIDLVGASYGAALSSLGSLGSNSLTLVACVGGTWNQSAGTCPGTPHTLANWTSASSALVASGYAPAAPGSRLNIQATLSAGLLTAATLATISVSVSAGPTRQIRTAQTTNS